MNLNDENFQELMNEQLRISKQITVTIEVITPEDAFNYLQKTLNNKSVRNRRLSARTVNLYVNDMINKRWKVGVPIIFDTNEALLDGQTRMTAVVKAKTSIISLVVRGVDPEIFNSLDCGKKRTPKDVLTSIIIDGEQLAKPAGVSSGIALLHSVAKNHKSIDKNRMLSNPELFEIVKNDFNYYDEPFKSGKINIWRKNICLSITENVLSGFYYANKKLHGSVIDDFLTLITSNLATTPPIVREFRDMMITNKGKKSDEKGYLAPYKVYYLVDTLFKYGQEKRGLENRKHFSITDLKLING